MRAPIDALRSMKKYLADVLPEYELRLSREDGTFSRPFGRVGLAGAANYPVASGAITGDVIQPFAVHLYPRVGSTPDESLLITLEEEERLYRAFRGGLRPLRVPLWDWQGIGLLETTLAEPVGFMRVSDVSIDRQIDNDDERVTFLALDIRVTWRRRLHDPGPDVPVVAVTADLLTP